MTATKTVRVCAMGYLPNGDLCRNGYMDLPAKKAVEIAGHPAFVHRPATGSTDTWVVSSYGRKWHHVGASTIKAAIEQAEHQAKVHAAHLTEAIDKARKALAEAEANGPVTIKHPYKP